LASRSRIFESVKMPPTPARIDFDRLETDTVFQQGVDVRFHLLLFVSLLFLVAINSVNRFGGSVLLTTLCDFRRISPTRKGAECTINRPTLSKSISPGGHVLQILEPGCSGSPRCLIIQKALSLALYSGLQLIFVQGLYRLYYFI